VATKSEILGYNFRWMWHQVGEGITSDERRCTVDTLFFLVLFVALCFLPSVSLVPFQLCVLPATEYKQAQTVLARYNTKVTVLVRNPEV